MLSSEGNSITVAHGTAELRAAQGLWSLLRGGDLEIAAVDGLVGDVVEHVLEELAVVSAAGGIDLALFDELFAHVRCRHI